MKDLFKIPENLSDLNDEELSAFITQGAETAQRVATTPDEFAADFTPAELLEATTDLVASVEEAKGVLASRQNEEPAEEPAEVSAEAFAELASRAQAAADEATAAAESEEAAADGDDGDDGAEDGDDAGDGAEDGDDAQAAAETEAVTAAAKATRLRRLPSRSRRSTPVERDPEFQRVALTAAAEGLGYALGQELGETDSEEAKAIARMEIRRRNQFGTIAEGTHGDTIPIARAEWGELYPEDRRLGGDGIINWDRIQAVTASASASRDIKAAFDARMKKYGADSLTAAGGLCAPLTPYYGLQMLSTDDRPVRAALTGFNADRGGIISAAPAALTAIDGGVGVKTMTEDAAGGSAAVKTCQIVDCPPFDETVIAAIYHCLQFGNIGARTFPELLEQWNSLVMAAQARVAETRLLDGMKAASTHVTAGSDGLGASATLPSQIITAAVAFRSRHRMRIDAVLRVLLPSWVLQLLVSDVYRSQFQRFDMTPESFVALLRSHNVEPGFYIDGTSDGDQVFDAQSAGALLTFPPHVEWFLYPEGSFLFLDGGSLELGLVRDSVLNSTNDFQLFGETWENVAFVGIESLWVQTTTCDSGQVNAPVNSGCITY